MVAQNFFALFAPARTRTAIAEQISGGTHTAMAGEESRGQLVASLRAQLESSRKAVQRFVHDEVVHWTPDDRQ